VTTFGNNSIVTLDEDLLLQLVCKPEFQQGNLGALAAVNGQGEGLLSRNVLLFVTLTVEGIRLVLVINAFNGAGRIGVVLTHVDRDTRSFLL